MDPQHDVQQCDEANLYLQKSTCCNKPVPDECKEGGFPPFNALHFDAQPTNNNYLKWSKIVEEITGQHPIVFSWHWNSDYNSGHMMVIIGYVDGDNDDRRTVIVYDPSLPTKPRPMSYAYYKEDSQDHSHWNDYYDIAYRP